MVKNRVLRAFLFVCAWISLVLGLIGIPLPLLPTTPFLLLSAFLFTKSSERFHTWFSGTTVYNRYVKPFKEKGGIPIVDKVRILAVSFLLMSLSAVLLPHIHVWIVLGLVALWLLFLMLIRIPTIPKDGVSSAQDDVN